MPGSSAYVEGGIVAYHNRVKIRELDVPEQVLNTDGAVSEACALAMAEGVRLKFQVDFGIAITGIAGPDGGTEEKPVGLFYVAIASEAGSQCWRWRANGGRAQIREYGVHRGLECLWKVVRPRLTNGS